MEDMKQVRIGFSSDLNLQSCDDGDDDDTTSKRSHIQFHRHKIDNPSDCLLFSPPPAVSRLWCLMAAESQPAVSPASFSDL